jgi:hypothetical protein
MAAGFSKLAAHISKEAQLAMTCTMPGTIVAGALAPGMSGEVNATIRSFATTVSGVVNVPRCVPDLPVCLGAQRRA